MPKIRGFIFLTFLLFTSLLQAQTGENACWFLRDGNGAVPPIMPPSDTHSVLIDNYFRIFYASNDKRFTALDANGLPRALSRYAGMFARAHHFLQIELGWKLPATRVDLGHPELHVYFVKTAEEFQGTTQTNPELGLIFNSNVLSASDFPAIFIHQFAHASELQYRSAGDYWFFEATAGWMEGQFDAYSAGTRDAIAQRFSHPGLALTDSSPAIALGSARFLDFLARPYKDIVRQIWERWSNSTQEPLLELIQEVLSVNHLPDFASYLQNYFLLFSSDATFEDDAEIELHPYSAGVVEGNPLESRGGMRFLFTPAGSANYSATFIFYGVQQKQGTLSIRSGLNGPWSISVPFAGLDHYKLVIVNSTGAAVRGKIQRVLDGTIPAVLEYFRVNPSDGGTQIEWKSSRENGVAFWNLYSIRNGQKVLINDFPIPAAIQSEEGIHYLYFDTSAGALYSLEAITSEGFQSPIAGAEKPQ